MPLSLAYDEVAESDLAGIIDWIGARADPETARAYVERIRGRCARLPDYPRAAQIRRKSRPTVYSVPFGISATIPYRVTRTEVVILRVLRRGRDVEAIVHRTR